MVVVVVVVVVGIMSWCERLKAINANLNRDVRVSSSSRDDETTTSDDDVVVVGYDIATSVERAQMSARNAADCDHDSAYGEPEAVFLGGPPGVGKHRILRSLYNDRRYLVSRINYRTLSIAYKGDVTSVIKHLTFRRTGNMIYEHTNLCIEFVYNVIHTEVARRFGDSDSLLGILDVYKFYDFCRDTQRRRSSLYARWRYQQMLLLLDLRGSYFAKMINRYPYLYLYIIAYLSIMGEYRLYPHTVMLLVYDERDKDAKADRLGIYELVENLCSRVNQISICRDVDCAREQLKMMHRPLSIY